MRTITTTPFATAFRNQLWLVGRGKRRIVFVGGALALVVFFAAVFAARVPVLHGRSLDDGGLTLHFEWFTEADFGMPDAPGLLAVFLGFVIVMFIGLLRPFDIWAGEPPHLRAYHWLLPITRWKHDLARMLAGGVAVLAAIAVMTLAALLGLALGGRSGALGALGGVAIMNLVSGPLTVYLLASALAIGTNRPGRNFLLTWFALTVPYVFVSLVDAPGPYAVLHAIAGGPYSYATAFVGGFTGSMSASPASETTWPIAAALWFFIALGAVAWALFRRREA